MTLSLIGSLENMADEPQNARTKTAILTNPGKRDNMGVWSKAKGFWAYL